VTQILSCLTRDYVLQVSDRRLTYLCRDGTLKLDEDDQTKAIVVNRALIFAYAVCPVISIPVISDFYEFSTGTSSGAVTAAGVVEK
jgi:hypothetical protein